MMGRGASKVLVSRPVYRADSIAQSRLYFGGKK